MSTYEISDDEDTFEEALNSNQYISESSIMISSDDNSMDASNLKDSDSSDCEVNHPNVNLKKTRSAVIKRLFPFSTNKNNLKNDVNNGNVQKVAHMNPPKHVDDIKNAASVSKPFIPVEKTPGVNKMIGGVLVNMPVEPYGCQLALMSKVITAIKTSQNCLLESPTGTGKTLALLCSALAWQRSEKNRIGQIQVESYFSDYPELKKMEGAANYIATPSKVSPEKKFERPVFGEKSIYDKPETNEVNSIGYGSKRQEPLREDSQDSPDSSLVTIHAKRQRLKSSEIGECSKSSPSVTPVISTPGKGTNTGNPETPQHVSVPTIYYGARTHKQIQQVIKEFKRTAYCGEAAMSILSSREYSCIRELDRSQWGNKNDMCRGCIKVKNSGDKSKGETNCAYYNNRTALNHRTLPPAFDLEDLVNAGVEKTACPYYAAKHMASNAHIVFCPYNYLIEPSIRSSMQIELENNIVIIDEAHNIEDICRDAASITFSRDDILAAIVELEKVSAHRYSNNDALFYIDQLLKTLKSWDYWFANHLQLLADKPVVNNEVVHTWQAEHFVQTLDNHSIGQKQFAGFQTSADTFCQRLRDDHRTLPGVTQATGTLVESILMGLGYLFRSSGKYLDDFTPALVKTVAMNSSYGAKHWRRSQYAQNVEKEKLELRLMCMNPAVIFEDLKVARCVVLASGTLTPLISLYSELATEFPLKVSPGHVIPKDRVWVGSLGSCSRGRELQCRSNDTSQPAVQDALADAILLVCRVTPNGVLCFVPSYKVMDSLVKRWTETGIWNELDQLKHVFTESRNVRDHNDVMDDYYKYAATTKGAILFAVFRGKVSEGMDFKDHQARAVVTIGIPYPNTYDMAVKAKLMYNDKYTKERGLLPRSDWLLVQAYRALNQAVGRCVRHRADWGAVLLIDARFRQPCYTKHLSGWVRNLLGNNHHTFNSLVNSPNSLESFMQYMKISESEKA
ncbi:Fanconi anemia group J protein homolog isoform X2 [Galleria mellonella]|uniref:Fanconi anemia group J protein homolog isoform X2 n=1 Tax=Galleria mellonella TaxID=7137 RepID=A0A6J1WK75_GALME|nr:Fanconi anemia group J protein homolog isoform X2 [Galleria mellonella]